MRVLLHIPALHCDGCIASVAQVLEEFPSVNVLAGDLAAKELTVEYDLNAVTPAAMSAHLSSFGYPVRSTRSA